MAAISTMFREFASLSAGLLCVLAVAGSTRGEAVAPPEKIIDPGTLTGKVLCGYQGWFRCPTDGARLGWVHWSRDPLRLTPRSLTVEMWPDMKEYSLEERFAVPGFSHADGQPAVLFSSAHPRTVLRHFEWMRDYGIDGAWLQHFVVDLPGEGSAERYATRLATLRHVARAAEQTGRVWALTYDITGMPQDQMIEVLTNDWKKLIDQKFALHPRYLRQNGLPVVEVFGFYRDNNSMRMTVDLAEQLIDFFHRPGPYQAYLVGGGDWDWRRNPDVGWQRIYARLDAYLPWNVGNYSTNGEGEELAATGTWRDDLRRCRADGMEWLPTIYPGFGWANLKQLPRGGSRVSRRGGRFLWEQFHELAQMGHATAFVAMFDEVDEGTAIFKVTNSPPQQGDFIDYEGFPSDWYLRLVGEGTKMLRAERPITAHIPLAP